jgi:hypothetical protein
MGRPFFFSIAKARSMAMFKRFIFTNFHTGPNQPSNGGSPWSGLLFNSIHTLLSIAFTFIGLAVLVLLFPLVLAYFVAGIFFLVAFFSLRAAWRLYWRSRPAKPTSRKHVDVEIIDSDNLHSHTEN